MSDQNFMDALKIAVKYFRLAWYVLTLLAVLAERLIGIILLIILIIGEYRDLKKTRGEDDGQKDIL